LLLFRQAVILRRRKRQTIFGRYLDRNNEEKNSRETQRFAFVVGRRTTFVQNLFPIQKVNSNGFARQTFFLYEDNGYFSASTSARSSALILFIAMAAGFLTIVQLMNYFLILFGRIPALLRLVLQFLSPPHIHPTSS
jgi:hypothetical protein